MNYKDESPKLELQLRLSPPRDHQRQMIQSPEYSSTEISPRSSCVSREASPDGTVCFESGTMILVGCPRCLMYVMLFEDDPKCPKCKSTVLLDFMHDETIRGFKK
ncbi:hypothetical protein ABFS83_04G214300 [Erythranthe nasuta]|uniref:GIR1-like zinc ribbon domain-containing protein n=2 Tax=Erythranthe guttata TaxID=4155 RepID=A0A022QPX4_ERYGU|nr:hypothetical protein MIMGU_mgv1a016846mg [Erythranthe guttata]